MHWDTCPTDLFSLSVTSILAASRKSTQPVIILMNRLVQGSTSLDLPSGAARSMLY